MTMVRLPWRNLASSATIWLTDSTSMLEKGSSSRSSSGTGSSTRASEVRWRMPCEYWPKVRVSSGSRPTWRRASAGTGSRGRVEAGEVAQVLLGGQLVVQHGRVAHVADAGARIMRLLIAEDLDGAEAGAQESGQNAQQRRFARAVFADQDVAAAGLKIAETWRSAAKEPKSLETPSRRAE
jgi:hypothetical protein